MLSQGDLYKRHHKEYILYISLCYFQIAVYPMGLHQLIMSIITSLVRKHICDVAHLELIYTSIMRSDITIKKVIAQKVFSYRNITVQMEMHLSSNTPDNNALQIPLLPSKSIINIINQPNILFRKLQLRHSEDKE